MGNHQKCWIWGRHAVLESLRSGRWLPLELRVAEEALPADLLRELRHLAAAANVQMTPSTASGLEWLCRARDHQGLAARMPAYHYQTVSDILTNLPQNALVLVLCGIQDPFNFGSILRSADLFGAAGVIVAESGQAEVTAHVVRSSVGAVNWLSIARTPDLSAACRSLRGQGLTVLAATERGEPNLGSLSFPGGAALLIGNEGTGVPAELLALADAQLQIPTGGHVGSLNAAVAAGILCHSLRQKLSG